MTVPGRPRRPREPEEQQRAPDGDDLRQGARVGNAEGKPAAAARPGDVDASGAFPGRPRRRSTCAASARCVTPEVALADVIAAGAARNRDVNPAGVAGRLELDPTIVREVRLHPRVRVLAADDVAADAGVVRARPEPADQPRRDAQRPEHVPHRARKELAVALVRGEEEILEGIGAEGRPLWL